MSNVQAGPSSGGGAARPMLQPIEVEDDRILCPHCGRRFAEMAADRHIPKCKDQFAKPNRLNAGGGRGAHMRR
ncbi:MAG: hypothetical protein WDW36_007813 [Sanguina aurantia]